MKNYRRCDYGERFRPNAVVAPRLRCDGGTIARRFSEMFNENKNVNKVNNIFLKCVCGLRRFTLTLIKVMCCHGIGRLPTASSKTHSVFTSSTVHTTFDVQ